MRVRITCTIDVSDEHRRGLAWHLGKSGLASNAEVREHYLSYLPCGLMGVDDLDEWAEDAAEADWIAKHGTDDDKTLHLAVEAQHVTRAD